jgi:hypothetical protein
MAFTISGTRVTLAGPCPVDEAPDLHRALLDIERPVFDLAQATHVHTAVAQVLLASCGVLTQAPDDAALAATLAPLGVETSTIRNTDS